MCRYELFGIDIYQHIDKNAKIQNTNLAGGIVIAELEAFMYTGCTLWTVHGFAFVSVSIFKYDCELFHLRVFIFRFAFLSHSKF